MNPNFVIWQPVPALALRFAIESDSPAVLQRARSLFAPWIIEGNADIAGARRWRIDASVAADGNTNGDELYSVADAGRQYLIEGEARPSWHARPLAELLTQIEYGSIAHLVANLPTEFVGLHSALLSREFDGTRRAVILVGPKEAGKSTLACALWRAGWALHCDDFTLLDEKGCAHPTARRVSLRNGSRELLGEELWQSATQTPNARPSAAGLLFHPHEINGQHNAITAPLEVGAICFLKRRGVEMAPAQAAPLGDIEAAFALLPYSTLLLDKGEVQASPASANWGAVMGVLAARIRNIALYDVGRGQPAAMIRTIEQLVFSNAD